MPWAVITLGATSVAAGLAEAGILAVIAQAALVLAEHSSHVRVHIGDVQLRLTLDALLGFGIALTLTRLILGLAIAYVPAWISDTAQARMRSELFAAFSDAAWDVQSRDREGHFQELVTNHIGQAGGASATAAQLIACAATFMVLVMAAVALSPLVALGIMLLVGGLAVLLRPLGTIGRRRAGALSEGWLAYAGGVSEAVRIAEEVHSFGVGAQQRGRLDDLIAAFRGPNLHAMWLSNLVTSVYQGFIYLVLLVALAVLSLLNAHHLAALSVVVLMLVRSGSYGQQIQAATQKLRQLEPYVERVRGATSRYRASVHQTGRRTIGRLDQLSFRSVSFGYDPGTPVLQNISFDVAAGEAVGIVGPSGAGKSTLVQVLLRLRAPVTGDYVINERPVGEFSREEWHKTFAYVPQEPRLIHASVTDNIRFFRDISTDAIELAARYAGIHDEIVQWPSGYDTIVGPRADAISGGQQQRICLARALAARPQVLILDEPTSALDPLAEQRIQGALVELKDRLTLFVVAHRMSTLEICQRIMVIADGQLEAFSDAKSLAASNRYYRDATRMTTAQSDRRSADAPAATRRHR